MRTTYEQLLANLRKWATNMGPSTLAAVTLLHDSDWLKSQALQDVAVRRVGGSTVIKWDSLRTALDADELYASTTQRAVLGLAIVLGQDKLGLERVRGSATAEMMVGAICDAAQVSRSRSSR